MTRKRAKKAPQTALQRIDSLLALADKRARQNSAYTLEQASVCANVAQALLARERFRIDYVEDGYEFQPPNSKR